MPIERSHPMASRRRRRMAGAGRTGVGLAPMVGMAIGLTLAVMQVGRAQTTKAAPLGPNVIVVQPDLAYQATMGMTNALLGAATGTAPTTVAPYPGAPLGMRNPYHPDYGGPAGALAHAGANQYAPAAGEAAPSTAKPEKRPEPGNYLYAKKPKQKTGASQTKPQTSGSSHAGGGQPQAGPGTVYTGVATAVSGGTLSIDGHVLALVGVNAPAAGAVCTGAQGTSWRCGRAATRILAGMLEQGVTRCVVVKAGSPPAAECSLMGQSINKGVVGRQ